ncbi:MAG: transcriptional repressor [Candidatus Omnitrophica bacterium]|nr:transcriptional repressor [Candidatus Omnitrophota bacterium]
MTPKQAAARFERVQELLTRHNIRLTPERRLIVERAVAFLHFTAEGLVSDVHKRDSSVARATVYRTLALLQDVGVVEKHDFRYGPPNYEATFAKAHHDHLMCIHCGEIIEFQEPRVETIQEEVVRRYGYELLSHTHKLYGLCKPCQRSASKRLRSAVPPALHVEEVVA